MPLNKHLIEVNPKGLIACRECRASADVSMNESLVELICPSCYRTLGSWVTTSEAAVDLTAFVASGGTCMTQPTPTTSKTHYHVCWSDSSLDWKPCPTKEEAVQLASAIKRRNESYIIVQRDEHCERCNVFYSGAEAQIVLS